MKAEELFLQKLQGAEQFKSISGNGLTLCDPITQICKRIEAFFKADEDISCRYVVNNRKATGPKIDPDTGEQMTKKITIDGELHDVLVENDHFCEFRIFCKDYEKAQCLSNVVRHRHTISETYEGSDGNIHLRNHYLLVRVCVVNAVDPDGAGGGQSPWIADDDTEKGVQEIFGIEPIDWNASPQTGCNDRLAPSDTSDADIPKCAPDEYEQQNWENNPNMCAWKWSWLKKSLEGNKNIISANKEFNDGMNTWRFIECHYLPIVFSEDNLTSIKGYNSILPADLFPLIFAVFGKFQISTYARKD